MDFNPVGYWSKIGLASCEGTPEFSSYHSKKHESRLFGRYYPRANYNAFIGLGLFFVPTLYCVFDDGFSLGNIAKFFYFSGARLLEVFVMIEMELYLLYDAFWQIL